MFYYVIRRILLMVPTLVGITIVVFAISRLAPGEAVGSIVGPGGQLDSVRAEDVVRARRQLYGLDKPIAVQYLTWLGRVVCFDFGDSIKHNRPVVELIKQRLPVTLMLNLVSFAIVYIVALPVGAFSAIRQRGFFDRASSLLLLALWSLPIMWAGQMMIMYLPWFPRAGLSGNDAGVLAFFPWLLDRLQHMILPVVCLSYPGFAYLSKQVRSGVLENLHHDYVRTARAKGLAERAVLIRHVFRNSLIPVVTITARLLPAMIGGSVIVERIFSIPGMGLLAFEAVTTRDYNVVMAVATMAGLLNMAGVLLADIAYAALDPRVSFEGGRV